MDFKREIELIDQQIAELTKKKNELQKRMQEQNNMSVQKKPLTTPEQNWENICNELNEAYIDNNDIFLRRRLCSDTPTTTLFWDFLSTSKKYLTLEKILTLSYEVNNCPRKCLCSLVIAKKWNSLICKKDPPLTATDLKKIAGKSVSILQKENATFKYLYDEIMREPYEDLEQQVDDACACYNNEFSTEMIYPLSTPILLRAGLQSENWGRTHKFMIVGIILHEAPLF